MKRKHINETPLNATLPPPQADRDDRIRHRAYELYEARGREFGHDLEDWLIAETEVEAEVDDNVEEPVAV